MAAGGESGCRLVRKDSYIQEIVATDRRLDKSPGLGGSGTPGRGARPATEGRELKISLHLALRLPWKQVSTSVKLSLIKQPN